MTSAREAVSAALFTLVTGAASTGTFTGFKSTSRRFLTYDAVPSSARPWVCLCEHEESILRQAGGHPMLAVRQKSYSIIVYTDGKDPNIVGATLLNDVMDAIDKAIAPNSTYQQTLGGLVSRCIIDPKGKIKYDPGDIDGDGLLVIPVFVEFP